MKVLARWTRWRLLRAGDRGDPGATDAVWDLWLDEPSDELWAALVRWHRPRTGGGLSLVALGEPAETADVIAALRRAGHPIAAIARARILAGEQDLVDAVCETALSEEDDELARFCVEQHLAPAEPHRAAVFFLLTGQLEQYRLADPDHSLLAIAYRGSSEAGRARIREQAASEPDVVRVLAATVRRMARLTAQETGYLTDQLAARRDWPALWALAKDLPVLDAARAVHRIDGWRPAGPDTVLFDAFAAVPADQLAESHAVVAKPWVRLEVPGTVTGGSITPDGQRIAVATEKAVEVFTLPGNGAPPRRQERRAAAGQRAVLAFDSGLLVIGGQDGRSTKGYLERGGDGQRAYRANTTNPVVALARTVDGVTALETGPDGEIRLQYQQEEDFRPYAATPVDYDVRARLWIPTTFPYRQWTMVSDPGNNLIAFAGDDLHLATISGLGKVAMAPFHAGPSPCLAFLGRNRLVGVDAERVARVWRLAGDELRVVAERRLRKASGPAYPVSLPGIGVVAVLDTTGDATRRLIRYLDAETLADVPTPRRMGRAPTCLFGSPDGTRLAVGGDGYVTVHDAWCAADVTRLVNRPLAATVLSDLHAVHAQLDRESTDPAARPFLELLRACLAHRYGTEVAIGEDATIIGRADDIALGGNG